MIEKLYNELVQTTRKLTNSIDRNNTTQKENIEKILSETIARFNFFMKDDVNCKILENRLIKEFRNLSKEMFVKTNNKNEYLKKMQRNIDYMSWVNKARDINLKSRKYTVGQKEIFYAHFGDNIGSEQNGRRPVLILQNDTGNSKANTTIVAPVTTHQKRIKWDNTQHRYYVDICECGVQKRKYLDFYEVPLRLEGKANGLYGFVNVMHIREIDRKRIDSKCVGVATNKCFDEVINAINKNLRR